MPRHGSELSDTQCVATPSIAGWEAKASERLGGGQEWGKDDLGDDEKAMVLEDDVLLSGDCSCTLWPSISLRQGTMEVT